jgi:hypothetical protein
VPSFSSSCLLQTKDVLHADHVDAANTQNAEINLGYTTVSAPFNGVVTARKVSIGELVGGSHTTELAIIIRIDPIWVWFNPSPYARLSSAGDASRVGRRYRVVLRGVHMLPSGDRVRTGWLGRQDSKLCIPNDRHRTRPSRRWAEESKWGAMRSAPII